MQIPSNNQSIPLVIFDMDETLIAKDLSVLWHDYLVKELKLADSSFVEEDKRHMEQYYLGAMDLDAYISFSLTPLRQYTIEQIDAFAEQFVADEAAQYIYPDAIRRIQEINQTGSVCMIISATMTLLVRAMAKHLGIDFAEGVNLEIADNHYTGKISGVPSYQNGKVIRLRQWLESQQGRYEATHFYSDSINDLPLLLEVPNPVVINGCEKLVAEAEKRNWVQEQWVL
ncbi:HAD family hydrolase [Vibrio astriarenae]|uniref:HAD family hydrolase n=1 Tax=Vibrio astriarenae TaxID=1481923 RepID=UPI00373673B4